MLNLMLISVQFDSNSCLSLQSNGFNCLTATIIANFLTVLKYVGHSAIFPPISILGSPRASRTFAMWGSCWGQRWMLTV